MIRNEELVRQFFEGTKRSAKNTSMSFGIRESERVLFSYNTAIAQIFNARGIFILNETNYSITTSRHQSIVADEAALYQGVKIYLPWDVPTNTQILIPHIHSLHEYEIDDFFSATVRKVKDIGKNMVKRKSTTLFRGDLEQLAKVLGGLINISYYTIPSKRGDYFKQVFSSAISSVFRGMGVELITKPAGNTFEVYIRVDSSKVPLWSAPVPVPSPPAALNYAETAGILSSFSPAPPAIESGIIFGATI